MATLHQYTLRPVDIRDTTAPTCHLTRYGSPPGLLSASSSSGSSYGGSPPAPINGHNVQALDVHSPQGQSGTSTKAAPRTYPPPPTGHDLMRLFPPPPPSQFSELKGGPTSYYFQRQERAFFAQAGREQIRIRLDAEFAPRPSPPTANAPALHSLSSRNRAPQQAPAHPHPYHVRQVVKLVPVRIR